MCGWVGCCGHPTGAPAVNKGKALQEILDDCSDSKFRLQELRNQLQEISEAVLEERSLLLVAEVHDQTSHMRREVLIKATVCDRLIEEIRDCIKGNDEMDATLQQLVFESTALVQRITEETADPICVEEVK